MRIPRRLLCFFPVCFFWFFSTDFFLHSKRRPVRGKITKIGLEGLSYGELPQFL